MDSTGWIKTVNKYVEEYREELLELASELVRIPSENIAPNGYEKKCQDFLYDYLKKIKGIEIDYFSPLDVKGIEDHPAYKPGRNYCDRPNVVAMKNGGNNGKTVIFSSHVDTVSSKPLPWSTGNPFSGKIIDGRLYGRGSFDMKGALASTVMCLKIIAEKELQLKGKVIVESVVDEENAGSNGTLASRLRGHNGDVAILPEPSLLNICPACKGGKIFRISLDGKAGTGYGGELTSNPIYGIGLLAHSISEYEKIINSTHKYGSAYYELERNPRTVIVDKMQAGDLDPGGNIGIPDEAWLSLFINTLPGFTEEMLDAEFNNFIEGVVGKHKDTFVRKPLVQGVSRYLWPYEIDPQHAGVRSLVEAAKGIGMNNPVVTGAKFACDGFIFTKYFDTPAIVFGPRGGNAHAQDEFVIAEDLILLAKTYLYYALKWCN